ncbi:MAG TPA: TlpA disulfide reductase family protein [Rhodocyclaceae bacterium]|nr:TlpA disulfide reductase family protein [Rhodocyclaceae bacterium]
MKKIILVLVMVAILLAGVFVFLRPSMAPDIGLTTLDGHVFNTRNLRGKVVLVNFWATTCAPCMHEMPDVIETYKRFNAQGFETIAVAMNYDNPVWIREVAHRARLPFIVVQDESGAAAKAFGDVQFTPSTFLIDKHGRIVQRYLGEPDFVKLDALLNRLLAEPA